MKFSEAVGVVLRQYRNQNNLKQWHVAEMADTERNFISEIETGKRNISVDFFIRLCDGLDIDPRDMLDEALKKMGR